MPTLNVSNLLGDNTFELRGILQELGANHDGAFWWLPESKLDMLLAKMEQLGGWHAIFAKRLRTAA